MPESGWEGAAAVHVQVMEQTLVMYHRFSVKEMLRVTKMYEAIVPATEFINIPVTPQQARRPILYPFPCVSVVFVSPLGVLPDCPGTTMYTSLRTACESDQSRR